MKIRKSLAVAYLRGFAAGYRKALLTKDTGLMLMMGFSAVSGAFGAMALIAAAVAVIEWKIGA